ncbi:MAG TPA: thiamine pyrophosphate-dependent enzyme, partial [Polyangiaceae bacterium]|nr:thiamine pyrophosphate-dependent enzyme [Polyangiaceae bacterium]
MVTAPMGPVHLSIPSDVLAGPGALSDSGLAQALRAPEVADLDAIDELLNRVVKAKCPVLYVGDDAGPKAFQLATVAFRLGAQLVSSPAGKRWVSHTTACYKGVVGFSGHPEAREAIHRADLVVTFGATFDELSTNAWGAFPDVPVYAVDRHAEHVHRLPSARAVIANPARVIDALLQRLPPTSAVLMRPPRRPTPAMMVQSVPDGPVHPKDLMHWVGLVLPSDVAVHVDAGNSFSWSTKNLARSTPDTYRVAMGLSTMCWAISAAIGATVATHRRTICITGDGSMLMSSLELTVAVEQNLPVTYIVLNDSSLGMVRHGQKLAGAESVAHQIAPVRFDQLAKACGAEGIRIDTLSDLGRIARRWLALDEGGPCLIDVNIDRAAVPPIGDRVVGLAVGVTR